MKYDAFISYSHKGSYHSAESLQRSLKNLGRPWYWISKHTISIFRDESNLNADPNLWENIQLALSNSKIFILICSPEITNSNWVIKELRWWIENRPANTLLLTVSSGDISWTEKNFDWEKTNCIPRLLDGYFLNEPFWIDLRKFTSPHSLRSIEYKQSIAKIAASITGSVPEEIYSNERLRIKNIRRFISFVIVFFTIIVATTIAFYTINQNTKVQLNILQYEKRKLIEETDSIKLLRDEILRSMSIVEEEKNALDTLLQAQKYVVQASEVSTLNPTKALNLYKKAYELFRDVKYFNLFKEFYEANNLENGTYINRFRKTFFCEDLKKYLEENEYNMHGNIYEHENNFFSPTTGYYILSDSIIRNIYDGSYNFNFTNHDLSNLSTVHISDSPIFIYFTIDTSVASLYIKRCDLGHKEISIVAKYNLNYIKNLVFNSNPDIFLKYEIMETYLLPQDYLVAQDLNTIYLFFDEYQLGIFKINLVTGENSIIKCSTELINMCESYNCYIHSDLSQDGEHFILNGDFESSVNGDYNSVLCIISDSCYIKTEIEANYNEHLFQKSDYNLIQFGTNNDIYLLNHDSQLFLIYMNNFILFENNLTASKIVCFAHSNRFTIAGTERGEIIIWPIHKFDYLERDFLPFEIPDDYYDNYHLQPIALLYGEYGNPIINVDINDKLNKLVAYDTTGRIYVWYLDEYVEFSSNINFLESQFNSLNIDTY